jgi:hypothetical protein
MLGSASERTRIDERPVVRSCLARNLVWIRHRLEAAGLEITKSALRGVGGGNTGSLRAVHLRHPPFVDNDLNRPKTEIAHTIANDPQPEWGVSPRGDFLGVSFWIVRRAHGLLGSVR